MTRHNAARYFRSLMTILVTGAAGFVGRNLMKNWPAAETIVGVDQEKIEGGWWPKNANWRHLNLGDADAVEKVFLEFKPRLIVHLAGLTHTADGLALGSQTVGLNVDLTMNVLFAAAALRRRAAMPCKMIMAGSAAEYGPVSPGEPAPAETALLRPRDPYARSKAASVLAALGFGLRYAIPVTVLRFANIYGPGQTGGKLVPTIIGNLLDGKKVTLGAQGAPTRQWLYIDDAVLAIKHATHRADNSAVINIAHPAEIPNGRLAHLIASEIETYLRRKDLTALLHPVDEGGGAQRVAMDVGRLEQILGWKPQTDIETGVTATIAVALKERGLV